MTTSCDKCKHVYKMEVEYETDNWNLGHYGVTEPEVTNIIKGYNDPGCPKCFERRVKARRDRRKVSKCIHCGKGTYTGEAIYTVSKGQLHYNCTRQYMRKWRTRL